MPARRPTLERRPTRENDRFSEECVCRLNVEFPSSIGCSVTANKLEEAFGHVVKRQDICLLSIEAQKLGARRVTRALSAFGFCTFACESET